MMTDADRKRLAAILGMLGSNAAGERDNAARLAEEFRRQHGVTWAQLVDGETIYVDRIVEVEKVVEKPVYMQREIEIPVDRPVLVPMPFAQSVVDCLADIRTPPGFFIWTAVVVALLDVLSRLAGG